MDYFNANGSSVLTFLTSIVSLPFTLSPVRAALTVLEIDIRFYFGIQFILTYHSLVPIRFRELLRTSTFPRWEVLVLLLHLTLEKTLFLLDHCVCVSVPV